MSQELKALQASEIGLANMVSYQSSGNTPNIHEYGQARRALDAVRAALTSAPKEQAEPIDMVLHCPACGLQHIDAPEEHWNRQFLYDWENPPHRSHLCHGCGHIWRPADVATNGVSAVQTKGKADSPLATQPERLGLCGGDAVEEAMRLARQYHFGLLHADDEGVAAGNALRAHLSRMAGADAGAVSGGAQVVGWPDTDRQVVRVPDGLLRAIQAQGFTVLKTERGWELRKLGPVVAQRVDGGADAGAVSGEAQRLGAEAKEQAQVYASAWSLVGGRFDKGTAFADAETAERELNELIDRLVALAQHAAGAAKGGNHG